MCGPNSSMLWLRNVGEYSLVSFVMLCLPYICSPFRVSTDTSIGSGINLLSSFANHATYLPTFITLISAHHRLYRTRSHSTNSTCQLNCCLLQRYFRDISLPMSSRKYPCRGWQLRWRPCWTRSMCFFQLLLYWLLHVNYTGKKKCIC